MSFCNSQDRQDFKILIKPKCLGSFVVMSLSLIALNISQTKPSSTNSCHGPCLPVISTPENSDGASHDLIQLSPPYVVQLVRQVNYGPLESKRYFIPTDGTESDSVEVIENDLIQANFQKVNTYKNYKCQDHNKFFEVNIHQ
ncbi:hypothetical protein IWW34DRAFT_779075 [Fusarium oxysporum f. sp. albedinis]|nr:hypothetical protein IWW34DRAFT_779075 [Fusarium oxysporum f. sp. albedinis]